MIPEASTATTLGVSVVLHNSCPTRLAATLEHLHTSLATAKRSGALAGARVTLIDNDSDEAYRRGLPDLCASCLGGAGRVELAPVHRADACSDRAGAGDGRAGRQDEETDGSDCNDAGPPLSDVPEQAAGAAIHWNLVFEASNRGFGAAHNSAQRDAVEDYLLILNPDVELTDTALQEAVAWLAVAPRTVAINPRCARSDGSPEYLCKRYPTALDLFLRGFGGRRLRERFRARLARYEYRDRMQETPAWSVELLSGACLLCRREPFAACGGFDEAFFLYFEDFDLSLRLASFGDLQCLPAMTAVHHGGKAARKGWRHRRWFIASAGRFFARHGWRLR